MFAMIKPNEARDLRVKHGMSQQAFARLIDPFIKCSRSAVAKWEHPDRNPPVEKMYIAHLMLDEPWPYPYTVEGLAERVQEHKERAQEWVHDQDILATLCEKIRDEAETLRNVTGASEKAALDMAIARLLHYGAAV